MSQLTATLQIVETAHSRRNSYHVVVAVDEFRSILCEQWHGCWFLCSSCLDINDFGLGLGMVELHCWRLISSHVLNWNSLSYSPQNDFLVLCIRLLWAFKRAFLFTYECSSPSAIRFLVAVNISSLVSHRDHGPVVPTKLKFNYQLNPEIIVN